MVNAQTLHRRAVRVLPEVIKTSGVLLETAEQNELAAMLFPLRRRSNGAVLFRISTEMAEAMGNEPLVYLKEATRAREGLGRGGAPFVYKQWRTAWIPRYWMPTISHPHVGASPRSLGGSVQACFTTKTDGKALLVVIPDERMAVYIWRD
ncbi:MAG TPA: hypothetical protein VF471_16555 [Pseudoxanthomonas sp.]